MAIETAPSSALPPTGYRDLFRSGRVSLTLSVILLLLVATLDQLIVATAMPTIIAQLGGLSLYRYHKRSVVQVAEAAAVGSVNQKRLPCPGVLSAPIAPPWRVTNWRAIASPRPLPPSSLARPRSAR